MTHDDDDDDDDEGAATTSEGLDLNIVAFHRPPRKA